MKFKHILFSVILLMTTQAFAQITGKFGTYYDQRELLFEAMPTSENDIIFLGNSITDGGEWRSAPVSFMHRSLSLWA